MPMPKQKPGLNTAVMFSKASDEWQTPADTFSVLNTEFHFDVDAAASKGNCLVNSGTYFGPDHKLSALRNALTVKWHRYGKVFWLNPPYSQCREFVAKAVAEAAKGCTVVCLVPSRTDTRWWHEYVWDRDKHCTRPGVHVRFLKGRLKFSLNSGEPIRRSLRNGPGSAPNNSAPFPSVVIVFDGKETTE